MQPGERGSVTVELALALPAVALLLAAVLLTGSVVVGQLRCADGARAGARAAALREQPEQVADVASRVAGDGASVVVDRSGEWVTVTVTRPILVGPRGYGGLRARAAALARVEP